MQSVAHIVSQDADCKKQAQQNADRWRLRAALRSTSSTTKTGVSGGGTSDWVASDEDKDNSSQVLGLIQLHLSDAYLSKADDVATAKALWDKLEATFTAPITPDAFCSDRS